jgi:ATP-dependent Zn protease
LWGFYAVDHTAADYQTCLKSSTYWEACRQAFAYNYAGASNTRWYNAAVLGLAPIPIGWLIGYALADVVRWIRAGFRGSAANRAIAERIEATAYHEAGQAVITRVLGYKVGFATIVGDDATNTSASTVPPEGEEWRLDHQIIISYAGPAAQDKFDPRSLSADDVRRDHEKVRNLASRLGVDDETRDACRRQARELVKQHWTSIKPVAQALLKRGTLQSFEIDALLA